MGENDYYLFTDGSSYIKNKYYEASSAGILFSGSSEVIFKYGKFHEGGTNSYGELYAVYLGLYLLTNLIDRGILENRKIHVISDSDYVIKSLTSYVNNWSNVHRDVVWKKSDVQDVMYQDIFKNIYYDYMMNSKYDISFYHIKGHVKSSGMKNKHYKFNKVNGSNVDFITFARFVSYNHQVDSLAVMIRSNKKDYYEGTGKEDVSEWAKNIININPSKKLLIHMI